MKLKHSLFTRRQFLNGILGGWIGALLASLVYPVVKFIFPPYQEPDKVIMPFADFEDMPRNSAKNFAWGSKLGIVKRNDDGSYWAFVGVCTHLDCNVAYLPEQRKFFCACHEGWYNAEGINIAGPPPRPLRRLSLTIEGGDLIIAKESPEEVK
jgi:cytochrome b6-f complex iron-sulfur subunit